jgi:hypothetical protein
MANKTSELDLHVQVKENIIVSQTSYTIEEAKELLENNNGDYIKIILEYLKRDKPEVEDKQKKPSINQEIYRHIRSKMNENMDEVISRMTGNL